MSGPTPETSTLLCNSQKQNKTFHIAIKFTDSANSTTNLSFVYHIPIISTTYGYGMPNKFKLLVGFVSDLCVTQKGLCLWCKWHTQETMVNIKLSCMYQQSFDVLEYVTAAYSFS